MAIFDNIKNGNKQNVDLEDIQTTTETTLPNSVPPFLKVNHILGNSEQKTLSGKNKIPMSLFDNMVIEHATYDKTTHTITFNDEIDYFTDGGTLSIVDICEVGKTYTISFDIRGTVGKTTQVKFGNKTTQLELKSNYTRHSLTLEVKNSSVDFIIGNVPLSMNGMVSGEYVQFANVMIEECSTETPYEEYCGGVAVPNPSNPIAIKNFGDCVEMMQGYYLQSGGSYTYSDGYVCNKNPITCKEGDVINISMDNVYTTMLLFYNESGHMSNILSKDTTNHSFTVPQGVTLFNFDITCKCTPEELGKITLTINGKYVVPVKIHGKNIWGGTAFADSILKAGGTLNADNKSVSIKAPQVAGKKLLEGVFKENTQYTIILYGTNSFSSTSVCNARIRYTDNSTSGQFKFEKAGENSYCVRVSDEGKTIKHIEGFNASNTATFYYDQCGVFEGVLTLDDFEPYTEHTEYIYLNEPLRATDRIVEVDNILQIGRKSKRIALKDITDWVRINGYFRSSIDIGRVVVDDVALCTHFIENPNIASGNAEIGFRIYYSTNNRTSYIIVRPDNFDDLTTVSAFRNMLTEKNVVVQYLSTEETFTSLDAESQKALNRLVAFNGVTYIEVDSVVKPSGIEVEYATSKVGAYALKTSNDVANLQIAFDSMVNGNEVTY